MVSPTPFLEVKKKNGWGLGGDCCGESRLDMFINNSDPNREECPSCIMADPGAASVTAMSDSYGFPVEPDELELYRLSQAEFDLEV